jgi:hypothetical protein
VILFDGNIEYPAGTYHHYAPDPSFSFIWRASLSSVNWFSIDAILSSNFSIIESLAFNSLASEVINFLLWIAAMMFNLSQTVGKVEFPIAACSGFHASFNNKSKAFLWPRSTRAAYNSVLRSEMVSSYNCLNVGVIRPIPVQTRSNVFPILLAHRMADLGVLTY